jgi:hypothetical protein
MNEVTADVLWSDQNDVCDVDECADKSKEMLLSSKFRNVVKNL